MSIIQIAVGDTIIMKKKHPCGETKFIIDKVGSDIKFSCLGCRRTLILPREKIEKSIKEIIKK